MNIGERIKTRRKQLGISAEQIAEHIGVSPATIYRYESGNIEHMGIDKLTPIAKYLSTNEGYLMGWTDDSSPTAFSPSTTDYPPTNDEEALIRDYRELNEEGQEKVRDYASDLVAGGRYIKSDQDKVVDE